MEKSKIRLSAIAIFIVVILFIVTPFVYAGYIYVHHYPEYTLSPYTYWSYNYGCEWLTFKVTMDNITTNRRLYVEIVERNYTDNSFVAMLWDGYLEGGEYSDTVSPGNSENNIWVKVTETDGYTTYFKLHVEGYQYQR